MNKILIENARGNRNALMKVAADVRRLTTLPPAFKSEPPYVGCYK
jgi:hypothetical protein